MKIPQFNRAVLAAAVLALPLLLAAGCGKGSLLLRYQEQAARAEEHRTAVVNGLAFSLHPRSDVFTQAEPVVVDVRITNDTNNKPPIADINVYSELKDDGFLLTFELYKIDGQRKLVYASSRRRELKEEDLPAYSHFTRLQPGFYMGRPIQLGRLAPGIYQMTAVYASDLDMCLLSPRLSTDQLRLLENENGNEGFVKLWRGALKSNTVVFQVK